MYLSNSFVDPVAAPVTNKWRLQVTLHSHGWKEEISILCVVVGGVKSFVGPASNQPRFFIRRLVKVPIF